MAKYEGWTLGETEALLNVVGGVDVARAVLRGERKLTIEEIVRQAPPPKSPLVGSVVKVIHLTPYQAKSFADAVKRGNYDNDTADLVRQFGKDEVGLDAAVDIHLVQFDRDPWNDEMIAWGAESHKKPMQNKHLLGIGIQQPEEQRKALIVELGSARGGRVLYLYGDSDWRSLRRGSLEVGWDRDYLFGFVSE